jgi:hypothetical protein
MLLKLVLPLLLLVTTTFLLQFVSLSGRGGELYPPLPVASDHRYCNCSIFSFFSIVSFRSFSILLYQYSCDVTLDFDSIDFSEEIPQSMGDGNDEGGSLRQAELGRRRRRSWARGEGYLDNIRRER